MATKGKMFPETDFYRRKDLMFVIIGGNYYTAANSSIVNINYLTLCGLRFPLKKGRPLLDEESSYMKKNAKVLQEFKIETEKKINKEGKHLEAIKQDLSIQEDVAFFLSKICLPHNQRQTTTATVTVLQKGYFLEDNQPIFPRFIDKDYLIINRRLYPLKRTEIPMFVSLNGHNYTIDVSDKTVEEVESGFQKVLEERLKIQALKDSEKVRGLTEKLSLLQQKIISLQHSLKASKFAHCYECGDIGYDFTARVVYWLIEPHYNKTTYKSYKEGESAATIPFNNGIFGAIGRFAERQNRDFSFIESTKGHCMGKTFPVYGNSLEEKMQYLHTFADVVKKNGGFHE